MTDADKWILKDYESLKVEWSQDPATVVYREIVT